MAKGGANEFYNGSIAAALDAYREVSGLRLTKEDYRLHHGEWVEPVSTTYRGKHRIFELPPNPQGIAALQMLNMLELHDLQSMVATAGLEPATPGLRPSR